MTPTPPTTPLAPLRLAIAQPEMHWEGDDNTAAIVEIATQAAAQGAKLCVFPELAVTGFHRRIAEMAKPARVEAWLARIGAMCRQQGVAVSIGAPTFGEDGLIYNSQLFVDETGRTVAAVEKTGLTPPEATFFARGRARPVARLHGRACTAVICREIEDLDEVCAQLAPHEPPELVVWPGLMGPANDRPVVEPPEHVQQAQQLARRLGAMVVQSNWPNSLNYPEESGKTGRSAVIDASGEIVFMLPPAAPGLAVFTLGESRYDWFARSATPA